MSDFVDRLRRLPEDTLAALSVFSRVPTLTPPGKGVKNDGAVKRDESPSDRDSLNRDLNNVFNP